MSQDKPRYKQGLIGSLVYSPAGLLVFPVLFAWRWLFEPSRTTVYCVVTAIIVTVFSYAHGVNEGLLSSDHPDAQEARRRLR
jgi:hypothetical protein